MPETQFHLKRELTWGHIVSTIFLCLALLGSYNSLSAEQQRKTSSMESKLAVLEVQLKATAHETQTIRVETRASLESINKKLDRLIERRMEAR